MKFKVVSTSKANSDILAHTIQKLINEKQNMLFDSASTLAKKQERNHYLNDVVGDYNVYIMKKKKG